MNKFAITKILPQLKADETINQQHLPIQQLGIWSDCFDILNKNAMC